MLNFRIEIKLIRLIAMACPNAVLNVFRQKA
jgi:hypothetical protein